MTMQKQYVNIKPIAAMAKHHITFYVSLKKSEKITFSDYEFAVYLFFTIP